ncbi:MAG: hypothetical protein ACLRFM_02670 [Alphaproteobacteria bacterium]
MKRFAFIFACLFMLAGCAGVTSARLDNVRASFANNNFTASAQQFSSSNNIAEQTDLELLITGYAQFLDGDYASSDETFEEFNKRNIDTTSGSFVREATNIIAGRMSTPYRPYMMDSLFVSYYQIWDAIGENRRDDVRVIINQSYARQQKMSREYADLVQKNSAHRVDENNSELMSELDRAKSTWGAYRDIMNPALMYLSGIWFLNAGDFSDAETYLKRAAGMVQNNSFIALDLDLAQKNTRPKDTTWIFIESGFAPRLREQTISLPVITGGGIIWSSIAIAVPEFGRSNISIRGAKPLADVNAMFMTEFNEYNVNDALRAWGAASARTIAQAAAYNSDSYYAGLLGLASTIFSIATTDAEVRSWATLPENISVLRMNTGDLITGSFGDMLNTELPKSGNYLIYVRLTGGTPVVHVFKI